MQDDPRPTPPPITESLPRGEHSVLPEEWFTPQNEAPADALPRSPRARRVVIVVYVLIVICVILGLLAGMLYAGLFADWFDIRWEFPTKESM